MRRAAAEESRGCGPVRGLPHRVGVGGRQQSVASLTTISHLCLANMAVGTHRRERGKMGSPAGTPSESQGGITAQQGRYLASPTSPFGVVEGGYEKHPSRLH